jgi:hypothetical protein
VPAPSSELGPLAPSLTIEGVSNTLGTKGGGGHSLAGAGGANSDDWRETWHSVYSVLGMLLALSHTTLND